MVVPACRCSNVAASGIYENGVNVLTAMRLLGRAAFLEQPKLIEPMTRNLKQILESYKVVGGGETEATNN